MTWDGETERTLKCMYNKNTEFRKGRTSRKIEKISGNFCTKSSRLAQAYEKKNGKKNKEKKKVGRTEGRHVRGKFSSSSSWLARARLLCMAPRLVQCSPCLAR